MRSVLPELLGNLAIIGLLLAIVAIRALVKRRRRIASNHKSNAAHHRALDNLLAEGLLEIETARAVQPFWESLASVVSDARAEIDETDDFQQWEREVSA